MRGAPIIIGARFNHLVIIEQAAAARERYVLCRCDCGRSVTVRFTYVRNGHTVSCGCKRRGNLNAYNERRAPTKVTGTPEHAAWIRMRHRCGTPSCRAYANYGGRGIRVCDAWRDSFTAFLQHVGPRPSPKHSLDRINNDGHYEPGNVRWATPDVQKRNQRRTRFVTFNGETLPLKDWATRVGISQPTLQRRLVQLGWPVERALTESTSLYHHR